MSSESALETEDLENTPLVRMEDVQPSRLSDIFAQEEVLETSIIDNEYEECVIDDENSNIGSMVSIQSEEVICDEEAGDLIVPELLESEKEVLDRSHKPKIIQIETKHNPDRWPTLEILPGGVINFDRQDIQDIYQEKDSEKEQSVMSYACAKCSESFKYLFCLVKHVKWHEDEAKKIKDINLQKNKGVWLKTKEGVSGKKKPVIIKKEKFVSLLKNPRPGKRKVDVSKGMVTKIKVRKVPKKS